jgi:GNAT superfamily N-acetyltransferase
MMEGRGAGAAPEDGEGPPSIEYRPYRGDEDDPVLLAILRSSDAADGRAGIAGPGDLEALSRRTERYLPERDLDIAYVATGDAVPRPVAFSKRSWYSGYQGCPLYCQYSCLAGEWRQAGIWPRMVRRNEALLRSLHAGRTGGAPTEGAWLQAWSSDCEKDWITVLEGEGYELVRSFNNMRRSTAGAPDSALPEGIEVRPVEASQLRKIWEVQRELNLGVFECVEENWGEDTFEPWAREAEGRTALWQVAWAGDEVAGTVLAHYEEGHVGRGGLPRGFTEHIYVRPAWRGRGLASALIARALRALAELGVEEAELGVDSRNESSAFELYRRMGYGTESVDGWYRKPL